MTPSFAGSPTYIAPEILLGKHYDQAVDLWSIGVIAYIMFCGFPPFDDYLPTQELFQQIVAGYYDFPSPEWDNIPEYCKDFVRQTLIVNPTNRVTASQLLKSQWLYRLSPKVHQQRLLEQQQRENSPHNSRIRIQYSSRLKQYQTNRKATLQSLVSSRISTNT